SPKYGSAGNNCSKHSGWLNIDAILSSAVNLFAVVEALCSTSDETEVTRILQLHILGSGQMGRLLHKLTVSEVLLRRFTCDDAVFGTTAIRVNSPSLGSGRDQHNASCGTSPSQRLPGGHNTRTATGHLHPEQWVEVRRSHWSRFESNLLEIYLKLFGNEHGQRGMHTLPKFGLSQDKSHRLVGSDVNKCIGREAA